MRKALKEASAAKTKAAVEEILKENGLHKVTVCFNHISMFS